MFSESKSEPVQAKTTPDVDAYIKRGDHYFNEKQDYQNAIDYYKEAITAAEKINKNYYRIADIYRKIAMAYADLRDADKTNDADKRKYLNRSSHFYKQAIEHPSDYFPVSISEDEKKNIKTQMLIDRITNHYLLARRYLAKYELDKSVASACKAINRAAEGLKLAYGIVNPKNDSTTMSKEEQIGSQLLNECLYEHKDENDYIPYYEQARTIFRNLQEKYPKNVNLKSIIIGYNSRLVVLQRSSDSLPVPEKIRRKASFGSVGSDSNESTENTPTPTASNSIFTFLKSSPSASPSASPSNAKEKMKESDKLAPTLPTLTLGGN